MAEDAVVAGHSVLRHRPDLILVDVEMPLMTGLEFVQALKADPSVCDIPVVFISSRDDAVDSQAPHGKKRLSASCGEALRPGRFAAACRVIATDELAAIRRASCVSPRDDSMFELMDTLGDAKSG